LKKRCKATATNNAKVTYMRDDYPTYRKLAFGKNCPAYNVAGVAAPITRGTMLGPKGVNRCPFGSSPTTKAACQTQGREMVANIGQKMGRSNTQQGHWTNAPPGCSVESGGDWAVHWNTNTGDSANNNGDFSPVCDTGKISQRQCLQRCAENPICTIALFRHTDQKCWLKENCKNPTNQANFQAWELVNGFTSHNKVKCNAYNPVNIQTNIAVQKTFGMRGADKCGPGGSSPSKGNCHSWADGLVNKFGFDQGRTNMITGSWTNVPSGCSVESGGDWAVHWNTRSASDTAANNNGDFTPVCDPGNMTPRQCMAMCAEDTECTAIEYEYSTRHCDLKSKYVCPGPDGADWAADANKVVFKLDYSGAINRHDGKKCASGTAIGSEYTATERECNQDCLDNGDCGFAQLSTSEKCRLYKTCTLGSDSSKWVNEVDGDTF
jgi:hypothetical protein